jgi:hypothetical protein
VRCGAVQREPRGYSGICSQASSTCRPVALEPGSIEDEIRVRVRCQVTGDPSLKVRDNCLQRSVTYRLNESKNDERYPRILGQSEPDVLEDHKKGDSIFHSLAPLTSAENTASQIPRKRKSWPAALRLSFSR